MLGIYEISTMQDPAKVICIFRVPSHDVNVLVAGALHKGVVHLCSKVVNTRNDTCG